MATVPKVEINFKQLATTLIERSERGIAIMLLYEAEAEALSLKAYKTIADVDEELYSAENLKLIKDCFTYAPYEVVVISGNSKKFSDYAPIIQSARATGWIAAPGMVDTIDDASVTMQADLASWIKSMENEGKTYKAIGLTSGNDCKHYVYFNQSAVDRNGFVVKPEEYLASLLGILASCNINKGCTNFLCSDLSTVTEVADVDTAVKAGQLVLVNDIGGVRILTGINSLVSLNGNTATEDMQYIETVEAMDIIRDDIRDVFKTTYLGKFRNKYNYQLLFIAAVNEYYRQLADIDVLDSNFDNRADIDVEAQRSAWLGTGKAEAADWNEDKIRQMTFKRSVFIESNIKILNSMENLKFTVIME